MDSARESRDWVGIGLAVALVAVTIAVSALVFVQFPEPTAETDLLCACGGLFAPKAADVAGGLLFIGIYILGLKFGPGIIR
jgi:hypothetical protein